MIDFFFFFKQKTAYEMRISDWSSDVCSSDLELSRLRHVHADPGRRDRRAGRPAGLRRRNSQYVRTPPQCAVRWTQCGWLESRKAEGDDVRLGRDPRAVQGDGFA